MTGADRIQRAALWGVAAVAWALILLGGAGGTSWPALCTGRLVAGLPTGAELVYGLTWVSPGALVASWALMLLAMMAPLLDDPIRHVRKRTLARHRARAVAGLIVGYGVVWMAAGALLVPLALGVHLSFGAAFGPAVLAAIFALWWQTLPLKQTALNRCHARPALPGPPALAAARFGASLGLWCILSCGPIMVAAMLVTGRAELAMVLAALWIWAERIEPPAHPRRRLIWPARAWRALRFRAARLAPFAHRETARPT